METKRRILAGSLGCAIATVLMGCGGGGGDGAPAAPTPPSGPASVTVAPAAATDWWGYDLSLSAVLRDANNAVIAPTPALTWSSSAEPVAAVSNAGLVTLRRQGVATIRAAASPTVAGSASVTVRGFTNLGSASLDTPCVTSDDRSQILCWGWSGPAGQPIVPNARALGSYEQPTPILRGAIPADARIRQLTTSSSHACALTEAGQAYCWGEGREGKLGTGDLNNRTSPAAVAQGAIPAGVTLTSLWASPGGTCATGSNGRLYCWGRGNELPVPSLPTSDSFQPLPIEAVQGLIPTGVKLIAVAPAINGGIALGDDGRAYFWGTGAARAAAPVAQGEVPANVKLLRISTNGLFSCAVGDDGRAYCWGTGNGRRFGVGDDQFRSNAGPLAVLQGAVPAGVKLVAVTVGGIAICVCALGDDGNVYCWGSGYQGSLGNGTTADSVALTPQRVLDGERPAGVRFVQVSCGQYHCTALADDGRAYGWGFNQSQALARPQTTRAAAQPTLVSRPNRD